MRRNARICGSTSMKESETPGTGTSPFFKAAVWGWVRNAVVSVRGFVESAKEFHRISSQGHIANLFIGKHALLHAERNIEVLHVADALFAEHEIGGERLVLVVELPLRLAVLAIVLADRRGERLDEGLARFLLAEEPIEPRVGCERAHDGLALRGDRTVGRVRRLIGIFLQIIIEPRVLEHVGAEPPRQPDFARPRIDSAGDDGAEHVGAAADIDELDLLLVDAALA